MFHSTAPPATPAGISRLAHFQPLNVATREARTPARRTRTAGAREFDHAGIVPGVAEPARARGDVKRWPVPYVPIQASDLDGDYRGLQAVDSTALTRHDGEVAGVTPRQLAAELLPNLIPGAIDPTCSLSNVTVEVVEAKLSLRALLAIGFVRSLGKAAERVQRG